MPIRTRTPAGIEVGGVMAPVSNSTLFVLYGFPDIKGGLDHYSEWDSVGGASKAVHYSTFIARDPAEQEAVDIWAAQIDADDESTIRNKIKNNPNADTLPDFNRRKP
jgi:hypothetical protein